MAEQVNDQEVEQQEKPQTPAEAEASFSAGYHKVKGTTPEKVEDKPETTEAIDTKTDETPPAQNNVVAQAAVEPVKVFGMTEQEFKSALTQAGQGSAKANEEVRKAFGKIGEFGRTLQQIQANLSATKGGRKIDPAKLKRVNEELPGLGAAIAQDLNDIFGEAEVAQAAAESKGQQFDPEKYHNEKVAPALAQIETRMAEASEQLQTSLLAFMHPDVDEYLKKDEFKNWLQTLPENHRKTVVNSPLASVAGKAISDAKAWNAEQQKAAKRKTNKLEAAVSPKGTGAAPAQHQPSEDEQLRAGYKRARGR